MKVLCVIPARYASTRLPGKPLSMIAGKPMIQRVYERACLAKLPSEVVVATDNELVKNSIEKNSVLAQDSIKEFYYRLNLPQVMT